MGEKFTHKESLCLMWYQCNKCNKKDRIWNSRPRVTPFIISCSTKSCDGSMMHTEFGEDRYAPNHKPQVGERIFVDLAEETWEKHTKRRIEEAWDHEVYPMKNSFATKEEAYKHFMSQWFFGQPHIITIEKEMF